jgi:hypothetical protein
VNITGQINPRIANAPLTATLVDPEGSIISLNLVTDEKGIFTTNYTPNILGSWIIAVNYDGAEYPSRAYAASQSENLTFEVLDIQQGPTTQPHFRRSELKYLLDFCYCHGYYCSWIHLCKKN